VIVNCFNSKLKVAVSFGRKSLKAAMKSHESHEQDVSYAVN